MNGNLSQVLQTVESSEEGLDRLGAEEEDSDGGITNSGVPLLRPVNQSHHIAERLNDQGDSDRVNWPSARD